MNHLDCGAYGTIFSSAEEELSRHQNDLAKAKQLVQKSFPGMTVTTLLADIADGTVAVRLADHD